MEAQASIWEEFGHPGPSQESQNEAPEAIPDRESVSLSGVGLFWGSRLDLGAILAFINALGLIMKIISPNAVWHLLLQIQALNAGLFPKIAAHKRGGGGGPPRKGEFNGIAAVKHV